MNLKLLLRSLLNDRLNTLIIIISLAVGMACFSLTIIFINRELSTDGFHKYKNTTYALKCDDPWIKGKKTYFCVIGSAEYMKNNLAGAEDFCRIRNSGSQKLIIGKETFFDHPLIIGVSPNFFSFFSYQLLAGNPRTVLESHNNIVISEELAKKYFGSDNAMGQVITVVNSDRVEPMIVSGIFKKPDNNTQIAFDIVRQIGAEDSRCYIRLSPGSSPSAMEKLFLEKKEIIPVVNDGTPGSYYLEPLQKAYFDTTRGTVIDVSRDRKDLWIALVIGLMIIGIATFNYLGILTNRYLRKIKEYYLRRINGSSQMRLIAGFMLENSVIATISFLLGLILIIQLLPFFNELTGSQITIKYIFRPHQASIVIGILLILLLITLIFASYLVYSNPNLNLLKTGKKLTVKSVRIPLFNIFQLASSVGLIICSLVIILQMKYITDKPIGLDKEVIEIRIPGQYKEKAGVFREELIKNSSVRMVSIVGTSPVLEHWLVSLQYRQDGVEKKYYPAGFSGDENYLKVLGIKLVKGSDFSETLSANKQKCLINESFAKIFPDSDLIGKRMPGMEEKIITGIVKDFHYSGLKDPVEAAYISFDNRGSHLLVKPNENQSMQARDAIGVIWQSLIPDYPVNTETVGDRFEWFHRENKNYLRLIASCAFISIFLSMIGLFAISYQNTRSRTREIGIRKINGARTGDILGLLTRDFIKWVCYAFLISAPVAWYAMHKWIENYSFRTQIRWWVCAVAGVIVIIITLLTVSWQSCKASSSNPVDSLRYE